MTEAARHVALTARAQIRLASVRHRFRHRRMLVRIPVGRCERIVDLRCCERRGASLEVIHLAIVRRTLLVLRLWIGPRRWRLTRLSADANAHHSEGNEC